MTSSCSTVVCVRRIKRRKRPTVKLKALASTPMGSLPTGALTRRSPAFTIRISEKRCSAAPASASRCWRVSSNKPDSIDHGVDCARHFSNFVAPGNQDALVNATLLDRAGDPMQVTQAAHQRFGDKPANECDREKGASGGQQCRQKLVMNFHIGCIVNCRGQAIIELDQRVQRAERISVGWFALLLQNKLGTL